MKFSEVISSMPLITDLRRIAKARLYDVTGLKEEELRQGLIEKARQYSDPQSLAESMAQVGDHPERVIRTLAPVMLSHILLQKHDYTLTEREMSEEVTDWEQAVIDDSKDQENSARQIQHFDLFRFVVEAAWENDGVISRDEHRLIERIRTKFRITPREYSLLEAELGKFPLIGNELHSRDDIKTVRHYLQENGLLLTFRNSDGDDCDVIPVEMAAGLRQVLGIELRNYGYRQMLGYKMVRKKDYLNSVLEEADLPTKGSLNLTELQDLCVSHISPRQILGGQSLRGGLEKKSIEDWCRDLGLQVSGTKDDLIDRLLHYYDALVEITQTTSDEREPWFEHYAQFACRDYEFLRPRALIEKDLDVEHRFEQATDYLFEKFLNHKPLSLPGSEQPDGALSHGDKRLLWDNKSKEKLCSLKQLLGQFSRYFNKYAGEASALLVIAPAFTDDSASDAALHEINTGEKLCLITATELKELAIRWAGSPKADDPFPLRFLTMTGRFHAKVAEAAFQ
ncbi:SAP domain-containing protein [Verrucomicrobiaceae bacterium 227]